MDGTPEPAKGWAALPGQTSTGLRYYEHPGCGCTTFRIHSCGWRAVVSRPERHLTKSGFQERWDCGAPRTPLVAGPLRCVSRGPAAAGTTAWSGSGGRVEWAPPHRDPRTSRRPPRIGSSHDFSAGRWRVLILSVAADVAVQP